MRPATFPGSSSLLRPAGRLRKSREAERRAHRRRLAVEGLESRALMAVLPPAIVQGQVDVSRQTTGNESSPAIAVNPVNPLQAVAVWSRIGGDLGGDPDRPTQGRIEGAYTANGGQSWQGFDAQPAFLPDPTTSNPIRPFIFGSDAGVAFDRENNFYVVQQQRGTDVTVGAIVLTPYTFTGGPPAAGTSRVLYEWGGPGGSVIQALLPTVVVDAGARSFTDPDTLRTQENRFSGDVYVAWTAFNPSTNPQRSGIQIVGSSDQGRNFTAPVNVNDGANGNTAPRLAVSQGGAGAPAGQVTVVWDDFTTLANANPIPLDVIRSDRVSGVAFQRVPGQEVGAITDAVDPGNNAPHDPRTTLFRTQVNIADPKFLTIDDLNVEVSLTHPQISELRIRLLPPPGSGLAPITLLDNRTTAANGTKASGAAGTNLGPRSFQGSLSGTVFDAQALLSIVGNAGGAASTGYFRPDAPAPAPPGEGPAGASSLLGSVAGLTPALLNGTWTLEVTDFRFSGNTPPPFQQLNAWALQFTSGLRPGTDTTVATTTVRGSLSGPFATASAASPAGIGPAPTIASDNTLGSFGANTGRLYVAYVDRFDARRDGDAAATNPADNTDIRLAASDDGGLSWFSLSTKVNDDFSPRDGFSGSTVDFAGQFITGRPQFQPEVAVDQATGTLVLSFLDARNDAARARVATYLATSLDGGRSFGPQTFVNAPQTAFDEISRQVVVLGPIPENARVETTRGFGTHQGLAVLAGRVYPAYSSNENGGPLGPPNANTLDIRVARALIASGPRVVAGTMGPVAATTVGGATFNNTFATDGTQQVDGFSVTFDRPVDSRSFGPSDVTIVYRRPTDPASSPGTGVAVASITPLDVSGPPGALFLATTFVVRFATPQAGVGTYSYAVGPLINDLIRSTRVVVTPVGSVTATSTDVPKPIPDLRTITSTLSVAGVPAGQVIGDVNVNLTLRHTFDADLRITLIAPDGTRIVLSDRRGGGGDDFLGTVFDDQAATPIASGTPPFTGTFIPDQLLAGLIGKTPNGTWTLEIADLVGIDQGTLESWSLTIGTGVVSTNSTPGNPMDQNGNAAAGEAGGDVFAAPRSNGGTPLQAPYDPTTLPLIVPGPRVVNAAVPGVVDTVDNLVLNAAVASIDVTFDRDMQVASFTAADVLRVMGPAGPITGPITVIPVGVPGPAPALARTFRIGFPAQVLSGSYTLVLGSDIRSARGELMDVNRNAGLEALRGTVNPATGTTVVVTAPSAAPVAIEANKTISSTIVVTDDFLIQDLDLRLNITFPNDPDLSAVLVAPDGTRIRLFSGVGVTGATLADFADTVFDDQAGTPIQNGGPPFRGRFNPQEPLNVLAGRSSAGTYRLEITNASPTRTGALNNWALLLRKPLPGTGLGEPIADRATVDFRIFTTDPTNAVATSTWTPVGPAAIGGQSSAGRVAGLAIDPSDPSGNTVYVAGASGGVWKTTNFLTDSPLGPTYNPLTDFGPTFGVNMGGLAVFGRNSDPNQSIVFAATGEGDTGSPGVGMLRSTDGGATWTLLDSARNVDASGAILPIDSPLRNHIFVGTNAFKVVVDPRPTVTGETIVYAALSGANGGLWRSLDTGKTWQLMRGGQATDVVLDPNSGPIDAVRNPTGNLQVVYAAFRGEGVFLSQNQGTVLSLMAGGVGKPLIRDGDAIPAASIPVDAPLGVPNGAKGRIVLAKPDLIPASEPNAELQNRLYQGWLYAAVATPGNRLDGLFLTKDFGQNWTKVRLPNLPGPLKSPLAVPTNDDSVATDYDIGGAPPFGQANYDITLLVDPVNPNVVYLGGSRNGQESALLRVDTTGIADPHAFYLDNDNPDGGLLRANTTSPVTLKNPALPPANPRGLPTPTSTPILNLIQDPSNPFVANATVLVSNIARFGNSGSDSRWVPFDAAVPGQNDLHRAVAMRDPLTGRSRLIFGTDHGVSTALDAGRDGRLLNSIGGVQDVTASGGNLAIVNGSRNGNLQITQFYYGAAQPSQLAADISRVQGFFYGEAQDDGHPSSHPNVLDNGNIRWSGPGRGDGSGVATDQTGTGTVYQYKWPCCGGGITDFFQVDGVGRTFGLIQQNLPGDVPDPQWPFLSPSYAGGHAFGNFAVNPINGDQILISSAVGRVFGTVNQGRFWLVIAEPSSLDGTAAEALAYGAPDPSDPTGATNAFLYAGTVGGKIFVTFTGGGGTGNNWINLSAGLDGSTLQSIITNPTPGSREAYAVTLRGVYHMADSSAPGATWRAITGDLFTQRHNPFNSPALGTDTQARYLNAIQADWRYVIPDSFANPNGPSHPMLYVSGEGGVYRSLDEGATWRLFPDVALNAATREGGYLPNAHVTDLDLSLGNINPTTGRPDVTTGENLLLATTYGRGSFAIRLAPIVFPNTPTNATILRLSPTAPTPPGTSDSGSSGSDAYTNVTNPVIEGFSEQSAFGNAVTIAVYDVSNLTPEQLADFKAGRLVLAPIPLVAGTEKTDGNGRFRVQIRAGYFKAFDPANPTAPTTDGPKKLLVQATNASGTKGNLAPLNFILDTTPPGPLVDTVPPTGADRPDLVAASDSGLFNDDNITNVTTGLTFTVPLAAGEPAVTRVFLVRDSDGNVVDSQTGVAAPGAITLRDSGPVTEGTHFYYAYQLDLAGNKGPFSAKLQVRIDTTAPAQPASPALDLALPAPGGSDSGIKGDNITNVRQPFLTGSAEAGTLVEILDAAGNILGPVDRTAPNVPANGKFSVQVAAPLADGAYTLRVRAQDVAGNLSPASSPLDITILARAPQMPTLALVAADDTGVLGDNITSVTTPRLSGTSTPGLSVQLVLVSASAPLPGGVQPGGVIAPAPGQPPVLVNPDGSFLIQFPAALASGAYTVVARVGDVAGNTADSAPLTLQILTGGGVGPTPGVPTLVLLAEDDSGTKGDNATVVRRPRLVGVATAADGSAAAGVVVELATSSGQTLATTTTSPSGGFVLSLPNDLVNGRIDLVARVRDVAGNPGTASAVVPLRIISVAGDADGDGKADLGSFGPVGSLFTFTNSASAKVVAAPFAAQAGDIAIQGDFDGDGKADFGFYRFSTAQWFLSQSRSGQVVFPFGLAGVDLPVPADYDGDGLTDFATFRPTDGTWTVFGSQSGTQTTAKLGAPGLDQPVPADYDGDAKADFAVYRASTGQWLASLSSGARSVPNTFLPPSGPLAVSNAVWGVPEASIPTPADYDGDGKADLAYYLPSAGTFSIAYTTGGQKTTPLGRPNLDIPAPADYDGDGKADLAVFRPDQATWLIVGTASPARNVASGGVGDVPLLAPLQPYRLGRTPSGGGPVPTTPNPTPTPTPTPNPTPTPTPTPIPTPPRSTPPPRVSSFRRAKVRVAVGRRKKKFDALVLTFTEPLEPGSAGSSRSYRLSSAGRDRRFNTRDDRALKLRSVTYNAVTRAVTLVAARPLPRGQALQIIASGASIVDLALNALDGDSDGRAGGDFIARFGRRPRV